MAKGRLDIWFGDEGEELVPQLIALFDAVVPDDQAGQRGSKKAVFMRRLLEVDPQELARVLYPKDDATE